MAVASGIGSQLGIAAETTYGTYVAATSFQQPNKVDLKKVKNVDQGQGNPANRLLLSAVRRALTTRAASGSIDVEVTNRQMGLLIQALMGTSVTPTVLTAPAYSQVHLLADTVGKSLTLQSGVPDATGVVRPYSFTGCKITSASFDFEAAKIVTATFDIDAQDVVDSQTLVAASYPLVTTPFVGTQTSIKVGTYGSEAAVTGVTKASVKIDRNLATDRFYLGAGGVKGEPLTNAAAGITGTISADFVDKTIWADRFASDTMFSLVLEAKGALIGATNYDTFRITLPGCFLDGDTPVVDGDDVISGDFPFTCLHDGTNLPKIEIISTEMTLV